jgi:hypothetical protein
LAEDKVVSLVAVDRESGRLSNLSSLVQVILNSEIERLSASGDGRVLALASRRSVAVLDLSSSRRMFEAPGRFPAVSPEAKYLSFVDPEGRLSVIRLSDGALIREASGLRVFGVGRWSPDGLWLLVGTKATTLGEGELLAIDIQNGESVKVMELYENDGGDKTAWIDAQLLPTPK